jgi:hypothetical protein
MLDGKENQEKFEIRGGDKPINIHIYQRENYC